jgi:flagellar biosynthesis protein FliR
VDVWTAIILPPALVMARVAGFFATLPIFSSNMLPLPVRVGVSLAVTVFFVAVVPLPVPKGDVVAISATLMLTRELLCGLALGLAAHLVFRGCQVGARFAERQMGFAFPSVVDPTSGEQGSPVGVVMETAFLMLFLVAGGHRLLLLVIHQSFQAFPVGMPPRPEALAGGIVRAGSAMMMFGFKLASPILAAFVVLSVILGILARVLPEMNVLMLSFPLRVGLGLFMAAAIMPAMNDFTIELAEWMGRFLVS